MANRLDAELVIRGLISGRDAAKEAIRSGSVYVNGRAVDKPSLSVADEDTIELRGEVQKYVSRGGLKLEHALDTFGIDPAGRICLDCGASTGGFTDCMLQRGAARVYAVDVGSNQLAESLRGDPRVISREGVNVRELSPELFDEAPQLVTVDLSFISLALVLPAIRSVLAEGGEVIALIKPQFEAGRGNVGKRGVVKNTKTHIAVLNSFLVTASISGFAVCGLTHSPSRVADGNIEFLAHLKPGFDAVEIDVKSVVETANKELLR